jgi:serpin B
MKTLSNIWIVFVSSVVGFTWLSGCDFSTRPQEEQYGEVVRSEKSRQLSPEVDEADEAELAAGNSAFALDLYQLLVRGDNNVFYSPYSISLALAMAYAGAEGQTEQHMADTLHFTLPKARLHPAFNTLDLELESRGEGAAGADGEGFRLNIANAMWGQRDYTFLTSFLDVLALNYGAGLRLLDFAADPDGSRLTINDWVSDRTEERIQDLLAPGTITSGTRLVLTNAVYFNAAWGQPFEEENTQDDTFYLLDGSTVITEMMTQTTSFHYAQGEAYQAVELPYDGGELSMVILLPSEGEFEAFEASLDAGSFDAILADLRSEEVRLTMPKFTYESEFGLRRTLTDLGMANAFCGGSADFSGIDGGVGGLCISEVIHKAFVLVDEAGTEAAAATAVIFETTAAPGEPEEIIRVNVDRPFIFVIRDVETDTILFIGRLMNPTA